MKRRINALFYSSNTGIIWLYVTSTFWRRILIPVTPFSLMKMFRSLIDYVLSTLGSLFGIAFCLYLPGPSVLTFLKFSDCKWSSPMRCWQLTVVHEAFYPCGAFGANDHKLNLSILRSVSFLALNRIGALVLNLDRTSAALESHLSGICGTLTRLRSFPPELAVSKVSKWKSTRQQIGLVLCSWTVMPLVWICYLMYLIDSVSHKLFPLGCWALYPTKHYSLVCPQALFYFAVPRF